MNQQTRSRLRNIFAKQINKPVSEFSADDNKLFDDWVSCGLAAEFIQEIVEDLAQDVLKDFGIPNNDSNFVRTGNEKCRNCDNLILTLATKEQFGEMKIVPKVYCSYWYNKNKSYKNAFYNVGLNDISCTMFIKHKNVLDLNNIDISDVDEILVNIEEFATMPIMSFIDKGFNLKKVNNNEWLLYIKDNIGD